MIKDTKDILSILFSYRRLLLEMTKRDISDRYAGQAFGKVWAVIQPIMTISVFVLVFGVIFRVKADVLNIGSIPADHTAYMLSGLIPWIIIADVLGRSPGLIIGQAQLVKQVVFPLEILPVKMVLATIPTYLICMLGVFIYFFIAYGDMPITFLGIIPVSFVLYITLLGIAFFISSIGVFLRDIKDIIAMYTLVGLYLAPIFYFIEWVPKKLSFLIYINPTTYIINCFHDVFYYGFSLGYLNWIIASTLALLTFILGCVCFNKSKHIFGNFL